MNRSAGSEHIRADIEKKRGKGAGASTTRELTRGFETNAGSEHIRADIEQKRGK